MALLEYALDGSGWEIYGYHPHQWQALPADPRQPGGQRLAKELGPFPATVPGAVQADLLAAGVIPNPYWEEQSRLAEWVAARHWEYGCEFTPPRAMRDGRLLLLFDGIDPGGVIFLNGTRIAEHDGQFLPLEVDVTDHVARDASNLLQIFLREAPPDPAQHETARPGLPHTRFTAKWDIGTRCRPVGLWKSVRLVSVGAYRLLDLWARTRLAAGLDNAAVTATVLVHLEDTRPFEVRTSIYLGETLVSTEYSRHNGGKSLHEVSHEHFLATPRLWWPNGYGGQDCYRLEAEVVNAAGEPCDRRRATFGIRGIRYVRNEGAPPGAPPYTLVVNGTPLFLQGWNVTPLDHLYGQSNDGKARRLLRLAHDAGANMVRVWGGGVLESDEFYALCDELGLLVWQDFPQAGGPLPTDAATLAHWERLATTAIRARRNHPSLALWCGGDALTGNDGGPATAGEALPRLLERLVRQQDPDRLFLPSAPSADFDPQVVHGPFTYLGPEEHYTRLNASRALLHGACGCPGAAHYDTMHMTARQERLWPPTNANPLWVHRGLAWLDYPLLIDLFGLLPTLRHYLQASQFIQAEGIRYLIESARRRKWHCAGVLLRSLNEPWPNLIAPNVVDYFGHPMPAYYAAANAFRAEAVSARYDRLCWQPGELFSARLFINNSLERARPLEMAWAIYDCAGRALTEGCWETYSHPNSVAPAGAISWRIPEDFREPFLLRVCLNAGNAPVHRNDYLFSAAPPPIFGLLTRLKPATLATKARREGAGIRATVTNVGGALALGVTIQRPDGHWLYGADNYRHLLPGESWTADFLPAAREGFYMALDARVEENELAVAAWNTPTRTLRCASLVSV